MLLRHPAPRTFAVLDVDGAEGATEIVLPENAPAVLMVAGITGRTKIPAQGLKDFKNFTRH